MQFGLQQLPINAARFGLQLDAKPLQRLIESSNCLLFVDALVALQALDTGVCSLGNRLSELRLAAACRALQQKWLVQLCRQVNRTCCHGIGNVAGVPETFFQFFER
jgi:hypothetical protein